MARVSMPKSDYCARSSRRVPRVPRPNLTTDSGDLLVKAESLRYFANSQGSTDRVSRLSGTNERVRGTVRGIDEDDVAGIATRRIHREKDHRPLEDLGECVHGAALEK